MSVQQIIRDVLKEGISLNNASRVIFKKVKEAYNLTQLKTRKGNYFVVGNKLIGFTVTSKPGISEARQFYSDYEGLFCYNIFDDELHYFDKTMLIQSGSNLGNEKIKARTAWFNNSSRSLVDSKDFEKILEAI